MLRNLHLLIVSLLLSVAYSFGQSGLGEIKGIVKDTKTKKPVEDSKVLVFQNGNIKGGDNTDDDGTFHITSLSPGQYDIEVRHPDFTAIRLEGVIVSGDKITFLNGDELLLGEADKGSDGKSTGIDDIVITAYKRPLIDKDAGASGQVLGREDIAKLPVRSADGVARTVGGVNADEGSGGLSIRGSRSDASYYYIDGVKVRGSANIPKGAFEEVSVVTGGLPANYGDVTGGVISITTRGPSANFFGSAEGVTSGMFFKGKDALGYDGKSFGLDRYAYNLVEGMLSGPLLMKKDSAGNKTKPILGFLVSVNYLSELDGRPLNGGSYRVKQDVREAIVANPLVARGDGQGTYYATQFLRADDFENVKYRMNTRNQNISGQFKIDVNTGPSVNLSFGGSMNYNNGNMYSRSGSLLNWNNFGYSQSLDWRVFGRLTQRFKNEKEGSASKFKSAFYSLMVDYSQSSAQQYDERFKYNIFNYGHVGKFESNYSYSYTLDPVTGNYYNDANPYQNGVTFTASENNPDLARFTSQVYELRNNNIRSNDDILNFNGLLNGYSPVSVYNLWSSFGTPYNGFYKYNNAQFRVTGSGSVILKDHALSLGFEYEQRTDRAWGSGDSGPVGIWNLARLLANSHITEVDTDGTPLSVVQNDAFQIITYDRLNAGYAAANNGVYGGAKNGDVQSFFDYNLRKELGLNPGGNDFLQTDAIDPNRFRLDMFSADELLNSGNSYITYYGYDHTGNKVKGKTDIDKYFNEFDENGNYKRTVGAFQPTYISGYIMDKFSIKDLIFNVGVRVDVFDANQPVLKDKYLLYNAYTAGEARGQVGLAGKEWLDDQIIPTSVGDDYTVYVDNVNNPTAIKGFRYEDQWYNANGDAIEDPSSVRGAEGIAPYLVDPSQDRINGSAFEDYKAQVNVMPRISFSFPVSDKSVFFAHYDVLTKRPTTGVRFDPYDYQFIQTRNTTVANSNLKPETTIDYAIGFQQVLGRTSSIKIEAFYRELRNYVQMISVTDAYPATYRTFGNRDFGTVKGLTLSYDLRRTGNIRMTAAYTLQFADGTGSDATSQSGLIAAGKPNLRSIFPFSYDQRHALSIMFDYRYGTGNAYNGPKIGNFEVFGNMGLNILANIYSGNPYSKSDLIVNTQTLSGGSSQGLYGSTNGSNLPWQYRLDMQLDRTFLLNGKKPSKKGDDKKKEVYMNVYIRATNLFNQQNVLGLYRATGNWNDDGYLEAANNQASIQNQVDEQAYRDYYLMKVNNPYNISVPRQIRLGVKFDF